jgi:PKD repeat protein
MRKRILQRLFASCMVIAMGAAFQHASAQLAANTYQFSAISGSYTAISGGTAVTAIQTDDATSAALPIGFTFNYCGTDYTQIKACSNGWVTFNTAVTSSTLSNSTADAATIKPALLPLNDDLSGAVGAASYLTTGTAPNRIFTLQCSMWRWNFSSSFAATISYQVKLYESSNLIQYVYQQEAGPGNTAGSTGATIGIVDNATTPGYLTLNNTTTAPVASSATYTVTLTSRPATGQIYQFKPLPPIDMQADSIVMDAQFCSNASRPVAVSVSNKGTATITGMQIGWSVDGVAQAPVTYAGAPITNVTTAPNNSATIPLGDVFFPDASPRSIKAWVIQPNGLPDAVNTNDTVTAAKAANLIGVVVRISPRDTTICSGNVITLDAGQDHPNDPIYIWGDGRLTSSIQVSQAGTYVVTVQNTDGCFGYDTVTVVVHPNPLVNSIAIIDNDGGSFTFNTIGAQNITSYSWDFGDTTGVVDGLGLPSQMIHQYAHAGNYTVTLTLRNDCGEITVSKLTQTGGQVTGIDNVSLLQKQLSIFPNPARTMVSVTSAAGIRMKSIQVFNLMGQQVMENTQINADKYNFNTSALAEGMYNIIINTDAGKATKKLEVIR